MPNAINSITAKREPHLGTSEILLQTIVVAIDFSPYSLRAFKEAIAIARCFGSELLLVHGVTPAVYGTGMEPMPIECFEAELDVAKAKMAELIATEPDLQAFSHREFIAYARPVDLVQQIVVENKADLVVAGSHGARGIELLTLGSVAKSILSKVSCPVLIVGPHCAAEAYPFRAILFATDLKATSLRGAQFASAFAERFHSPLTLLHVIEKKSQKSEIQPELAEEYVCQGLFRLLPDDLATYTTSTLQIEHGKAGEIIPKVASSSHASLIVMGFESNSSFGDHSPWSTLSQVIRQASCPVLSIRSHLA
jgi:nucleotide-binding universal stress UspA family protein